MRYPRLKKIIAIILLLPYALTVLYLVVPPVSTLIIADLATLQIPKREWVSLKRISPKLVQSVIVSEDDTFCDHFGFDFGQIEKNLEKAVDGKRFAGASTITQQTVKNLFLWNGRSWLRKILEAPLTVWMEIILPKQRILEIYLNTAEWGDGVYGAEAAARHAFGVSASALSAQQAALLATALPDPLSRSAARPGPYQRSAAAALASRVAVQMPDVSCLR